MNTLYYGDNLKVLREYIKDESVDLIYLDPPFNSNRSYNVLFKDESGNSSDAQITAFDDAWHWGETAERTYQDIIQNAPMNVAQMIGALREFIGANQMLAYLVMMAARLVELRRVLKPTGSLYLHCDPTASHYLKILLDMIFGVQNFRNEINWKRQSAHSDAVGYGSVHDTILFYSKSTVFTWNDNYQKYDPDYVDQYYRYKDSDGRRWMSDNLSAAGLSGGGYEYVWKGITRVWRCPIATMEKLEAEGRIFYTKNGIPRRKRYLDESKGLPIQDVWTDLEPLRSWHAERLGYPTQKPLALLERIIQASSNPGDVVLDPFSGCGTCIDAAQSLGRQWIGIDITHLAIAMHKARLKDRFGFEPNKDYKVVGEPEDLSGAQQLAREDRYQFQWWALSLIQARPLGSDGGKTGKKGSDRGVDGAINFLEERGAVKRALVQVKSGHVKSGDIRDLKGTLEREGAQIGVFLTLDPPSREMVTEAASAGFYHSGLWQKDYPRIQILSVEDLLNGVGVRIPPTPSGSEAFKKAEKAASEGAKQGELGI
ncbi:MAG: site-specific DNA-methyltransferase [Anaerolinea sp.]|nr:site-specific DNA-methyltransferase [Anaerolinea sp.]